MTDLYAAFAHRHGRGRRRAPTTPASTCRSPWATPTSTSSPAKPAWTFDAAIFAPPFFAGAGFAGIKYLKSPTGPGAIQLFSNTVNGSPFAGAFNDPQNTIQLWRYLSGNISVPAGDQACNTGDPAVTRHLLDQQHPPADMRFFQSSTGLTLAPGGQGSIVVAYIFAAPVAVGGLPRRRLHQRQAGQPGHPGRSRRHMAGGVNPVDSMTGFTRLQ